jgi:hypothetical protein
VSESRADAPSGAARRRVYTSGMTRFHAGAAIVTLCILAGCQSPPRSTDDLITAEFKALALLERLPPQGSVKGAEFIPFRATESRFQVVDERGRFNRQLIVTGSETQAHGANFSLAIGAERVEFYRITEAGDIAMTAVIDYGERALTRFSPPLVVAFNEMPAGAERTSEANMRVVDLDHPTRIREYGQARRSIVHAADQRIRTPLGEFVAKRIESHFTAQLKMADVDERTTMFFVADRGVVAEQSIEVVNVLGAFASTKRRTLILDDANPSR